MATLAVIIAYACLRSVYRTSLNIFTAYYTLVRLDHAYIALFILLSVNVTISSLWTWLKLKHESKPDTVMLGQIVKLVAPLLVIMAAFRLVFYVLTFEKTPLTSHGLDSLLLAQVLIMGSKYVFHYPALFFMIHFPYELMLA
ncbi:hypothetical protein BDZ97DRAFT_1335374 [Flammula alnicola]|nr:hypothetical protein BDZ97DRAFT_1335374 [Flammula alnicola]